MKLLKPVIILICGKHLLRSGNFHNNKSSAAAAKSLQHYEIRSKTRKEVIVEKRQAKSLRLQEKQVSI
jgi:hypothetical protein